MALLIGNASYKRVKKFNITLNSQGVRTTTRWLLKRHEAEGFSREPLTEINLMVEEGT